MTRWYAKRSRLAAFLLPLLAATLACNALTRPAGPSGALLTQAAATTTAALAATQLVSVRPSAPSPTTPPTAAANTATTVPSPTSLATTAGTATPAPGGAVVLDPCSLITGDEAQSLTGVAMSKAKPQNGGCVFADAAAGINSGVVIYALPPSQSQAFLQQYVTQLKQIGVQVDAAVATRLNQDIAAGDLVAAVNDLIAMSAGQSKYNAHKLDGLGSAALWSWNKSGTAQQGVLIAARPGALVALILISDSAKEADAQPAMQKLVSRILEGLPASFTVAGLQVAGSGPVIDPCSLASASDAEALIGAKVIDGVVVGGNCQFKDAATRRLLVNVFALPAGVAAASALESDSGILLSGNATAEAKLLADANSGDMVAAVRDLEPTNPSGGSRTFESVDGLGDAAVLYLQSVSSTRIGIVLAARPGVLVGLNMLIEPGDNAATKTAVVALLTRILKNLPAKFTVNGVP
jgi:hypothetical protein